MCCGQGSDRSSQYRKGKGFALFFWKFLVTCCPSGQHSAPFHLWKAQTHKELTFPRGKLRERPQVPSEAPSGQRQRRGDRVTARRERGRKKEKTEKERSVLGGRSCTRLGSPGERAGDIPMAPRIPVPAWAGNPVGFARGIPVRSAEELPPPSLGIWSLPLHQHKKMMVKNKRKGALLRRLQCQRI